MMENKGSLIEGYDGDLTLVDLETRRTITDDDVWTRVGWTPYAGMELTGPAIIEDSGSTTVVHPGNYVRIDSYGNVHINLREN